MSSYPLRSIGFVAATAAASAIVPLSPATATVALSHQVQPGESISSIAQRFDIPAETLAKTNGISIRSALNAGSHLMIPSAPKPVTYTVQRGDTLSGIAAKHNTTVAAIASASKLANPNLIYPGQVLKLAETKAAPKPAAKPAPKKADAPSATTYTVVAGDNLSRIAAKHKTTVNAIMSANKLSSTLIFPGQKLTIGTSAPAPATATPAPQPAAPKPAPKPAQTVAVTYTVAAGDTLSGIAAKNKTTVAAITSANKLTSTLIYPGQKLTMPGGSKTEAPAPSSTATDMSLVPSTFLHYTYPEATVRSANENKAYLNSISVPSRAEVQQMVRQTAIQYGVDPALALAHAHRESGFDARAVSPANAIGTMQVIPSSGTWASQLVGRELNLLDPQDNIVAGVVIIRQLHRSGNNFDEAVASYYQGMGSVRRNGMFPDTKDYVAKIKSSMALFR